MTDALFRGDMLALMFAAAAVTYLTRTGGHLLLSRFDRIHPRVEAALEAVPAAVITALVVPPALTGGPAEFLTIVVAGAASLRLSSVPVLALGMATLVTARAIGL